MQLPEQTNTTAIQEILLEFLYMDYTEGQLGTLIHPFLSDRTVCSTDEKGNMVIHDITKEPDALKQRQDVYRKAILKDDIPKVFYVIQKRYYFPVLKEILPYLSQHDLSVILNDVWTGAKSPNRNHGFTKTELVSLFKLCDPAVLMDSEDYEAFIAFPDVITVYRGLHSWNSGNIRALSWTLDREKAVWFATRFDQPGGMVYQATIKKHHVLAYFNDREEAEIIVNPRCLRNVQAFKPQDILDMEPNAETIVAMKEAEEIAHDPNVKGYNNVGEMMRDILDT